MKKASGYHKQGYNCAEAMIKAFNEDNNTNIPVALGSGMGSGFTVGSVCGAVGAATVILGYLEGRENKEDLNIARQHTKELMTIVREKYGSELCKDLKEKGVTCEEIVEYTYEKLHEILK